MRFRTLGAAIAMPYEIEPHVGAGALRFGMAPAQVHVLLGTPHFARSERGRLREMYGLSPALTFSGSGAALELVEIGFLKGAGDVRYRGRSLFAEERHAILRRLCNDDPEPRDAAGTLVFQKLGISLTGFHLAGEQSIAVAAFAPGYWDSQLVRLRSIKLTWPVRPPA